jgi:hypothetical protein
MVRPTLAPLIILKTMNTNKAIIGIIVCLLLFAIIPVECEAVQFKSRLMKKKEAEGTKYLKSAVELQLHIAERKERSWCLFKISNSNDNFRIFLCNDGV